MESFHLDSKVSIISLFFLKNFHSKSFYYRAVGRFENPEVPVVV